MLIKNGYIIDPASGRAEFADLQISDGKIFSIGQHLSVSPSEEIIDASGLTIAPGLIDTHVHFRDPGFTYKEDIHTGASASAAGGFTSVICMANTSPVVDSVSVFSGLAAREKEEAIHIYQAAAVSHDLKGTELTDMKALAAAGACGFTDDGIPLKDAAFLLKAMELAAQLNLPISLHEEDPSFIEINGINHGAASDFLGIYGSPSIAEESLVARDCMLALKSGADVVIQHISSGTSVELVRTFKALGAKLHAEATPHHFTLTDEAVIKYGSLAKMNPPLRTEKDRLAIIQGLCDGTIDIIATDHAPHNQPVNVFSLTSRVGTDINPVYILSRQKPADNLKLLCNLRDHLIFKIIRNKRQCIQTPFFQCRIILLRITHCHKMSYTPRNNRILRLHVSVPVLCI